jgi:MFS family permease
VRSHGIRREPAAFPGRAYALAALGFHIAFLPLFNFVLPRRVEALFGADAGVRLSEILIVGAITASLANIAAGGIGDRIMRVRGSRRELLALSAILLSGTYVGFSLASNALELTGAMIAFQIALNLGLSPLNAMLADQGAARGRMAGVLNAALPLSALAASALAFIFPADTSLVFWAIGGLSLILILPLATRPTTQAATSGGENPPAAAGPVPKGTKADLILLWLARLLVQFGAGFLLTYLFLFVSTPSGADVPLTEIEASRLVGWMTFFGAILAILGAIASGGLSEKLGRKKTLLIVSALLIAASLALISASANVLVLISAFALFQFALACFLTLHTAATGEMLLAHPDRGALLGLMNLANTLPLIGLPGLTLLLLNRGEADSFGDILAICALASAAAALCLAPIRRLR